MPASAFFEISQIASMRRVHEAFRWLHLHEQQMMRWQSELVSVAAPPFAERARAEWLLARFAELGLAGPHLDASGNVLGHLSAIHSSGSAPVVLVSAHIDTVFPAETPIEPVLDGTRLTAPGACDNGAGVVGLLGLAAALLSAGVMPEAEVIFAGNVGEEGDGDLRGMRHLYNHAPWRDRIVAHLVLDGAGHEIAVTGALGSRRFEVLLEGSGGHSWTDAGRPNPIVAMAAAIAAMERVELRNASDARAHSEADPVLQSLAQSCTTPALYATDRSAWNVGTIEGGSSVNAIPEQARARFDLRSTDAAQLVRLEVELYRAVEDAVLVANRGAEVHGRHGHALRFTITGIGDRPAGALAHDARILELLRGVDRHLNLRTECRVASTDANIPLSRGVEAISIGAGGDGGGIHTRAEWYDARGRSLGLRRVLLLLLGLASAREPAAAAAD